MVANTADKPPVIILTVSKSFGEVDWILPVLVHLKEHHPGWRIITLFGHKLIHDFLLLNPALYREFARISSLNIVPQEIPSLFRDEIDASQVRIILKDYNEDQYCPFKNELERYCPHALVVSYPHSNHIFSNRATDPLRHCAAPDAYSYHDYFLLCSEHDLPYWSAYVDMAKIRTFGYPRYDSWWMERLLRDPGFVGGAEYRRAKTAARVFFHISRGAHPTYLDQGDYEYLLRSTLEEVLSYDDSLLLIKAHPRQDIDHLNRLLSGYDRSRWMVSGLHLLQLASLADVVISGWSSGILDALAVGRPVIEFWRFSGKDPDCRADTDGRPTTIYRELGLARPADSREELAALLREAVAEPDGDPWLRQRQAFRRLCKETDTASAAIAAFLLEEAGRRGREEDSDPGARPDALIETMIDHLTLLAEGGQEERAGQWLDFMIGQFPDDHRVLNNHGVLLFNRGDCNGAVDALVASLNRAPDYQEAAVNLAQILLALDRADDAAAIVLSFHRNLSGSGPRAAFLQTLHEQLGEESFAVVQQRLAARMEAGR
ncbi:MAG: hypothetical protein AB1568_11735 [Thermodesulfobacteriota bacterium]